MNARTLLRTLIEALRVPREIAEAIRSGVTLGLDEFAETWQEKPNHTLLGEARAAHKAQAIIVHPTPTHTPNSTQWYGPCLLETRNPDGTTGLATIGTLTIATPPTRMHVRSIRIVFHRGETVNIALETSQNLFLLVRAKD